MDSADKLVIEIDGRELAVINGRLAAIENDNREIHAELREIRTELRLMMTELRGMNTRLEDMKFYMSLTFGAIAVFVAAVALTPIVSKLIQAWKKPDDNRMRLIFREEDEKLKADGKPI